MGWEIWLPKDFSGISGYGWRGMVPPASMAESPVGQAEVTVYEPDPRDATVESWQQRSCAASGHVARQALVTAAGSMQLCGLLEKEQCLL